MPLAAASPHSLPATCALQGVGTLIARGWRAKLYASVSEAMGLRPEDLAAVQRAYRTCIATPGPDPVAGFAILRLGHGAGSLDLVVHWWEGAMLHRDVRMLPGHGGPPLRRGGAAERIGEVEEEVLMAREAAAWCRCVLDADAPSLDAYLARCCA